MTFDVVALCRREPGPEAVVAALLTAGEGSFVDFDAGRQLIEVRHAGGRVLLTVEGARLVRVPGEVDRLLGLDVPPPVWWVEGRAPDEDAEAEAVARTFAEALAVATGGRAWSNR
ncbi:hypothetical protein [Amycolatopsis sp. cg9]|uniref:hypothetical protein n=1 Tax=Amycolatopsis sp. cg9 TaxID=3238801 RepID=UPI003526003C